MKIIVTTKRIIALFAAFVLSFQLSSMQAQNVAKKASDPIRSQLTWQKPIPLRNGDGEIDRFYVTYLTPDGKENKILCELPWPLEDMSFEGNYMEEYDFNFDGIRDLQVLLCYMDATGHHPIYAGFVWNPDSHQFILVEEYSEIIAPIVDQINKNIHGSMQIDNIVDCAEWEWKEGKLVKTKEWKVDLEDDEEQLGD